MIHFLNQVFLKSLEKSLLKRRAPIKKQVFKQRLLYIVPTQAGWMFALLVLVLLIGSLNFRVNLGFILTFLLFATGLIAIYLSHQNIRGVEINIQAKDNVFSDQNAAFQITLNNPSSAKHKPKRYNIRLFYLSKDQTKQSLSWQEIGSVSVDQELKNNVIDLLIATHKRGAIHAPIIRLKSIYPFGFWRVWGYFVPESSLIVYPKPERDTQTDSHLPTSVGEPDEFSGIRTYQAGDRGSQIVWKIFLRTGKLFSRLYESSDPTQENEVVFDYNALPAHLGKEDRLSRLCRLIIAAQQHGLKYTLRLPNHADLSGEGSHHQRICLTALALF